MSDDAKLQILTTTLDHIRELDAKIEDLQDQRDMSTEPLERAAMAYHREHPAWARHVLSCSRCYYVYDGTTKDPDAVRFTGDCSWCDRSNVGASLPLTDLAKYL